MLQGKKKKKKEEAKQNEKTPTKQGCIPACVKGPGVKIRGSSKWVHHHQNRLPSNVPVIIPVLDGCGRAVRSGQTNLQAEKMQRAKLYSLVLIRLPNL